VDYIRPGHSLINLNILGRNYPGIDTLLYKISNELIRRNLDRHRKLKQSLNRRITLRDPYKQLLDRPLIVVVDVVCTNNTISFSICYDPDNLDGTLSTLHGRDWVVNELKVILKDVCHTLRQKTYKMASYNVVHKDTTRSVPKIVSDKAKELIEQCKKELTQKELM
jgi:hypothetical protein